MDIKDNNTNDDNLAVNNNSADAEPKDEVQEDLENQIEEASKDAEANSPTDLEEKTTKEGEGGAPDLGTAKEQMNQEDGIEIV